jgi:hypothetical protein
VYVIFILVAMDLSLYKDAAWNGSSYWHGTSTIFLDSIRSTGLGTVSAVQDLRLLDLLRYLYGEIERQDIWHPVLDVNHNSIKAAMAQTDMEYQGKILNYRHDGAYVSASALRAAIYACLNKVGSELLEKCLILLSVLISEGEEPSIPVDLNILNVRQFLETPAKPIMIEVRILPDEDMVLENGESAERTLYEMRTIFPKLPISQQFERLQFLNFRLLKPVPAENLRFYEVDFESRPSERDFQYYLSRI